MAFDEKILGFPADLLDRIGRFHGFCAETGKYLPHILRQLAVRERGAAEEDPSFKQLIPYVVFISGGKVFRYIRSKRGSEARLHELHSIGVGGHIAAEDISLFEHSYEVGMRREIEEEVELPAGEERQRIVGLINDDTTPVGSVHFGVVHLWELEAPVLRRREAKLLREGFVPLGRLLEEKEKFESWSQFVLDWLKTRTGR